MTTPRLQHARDRRIRGTRLGALLVACSLAVGLIGLSNVDGQEPPPATNTPFVDIPSGPASSAPVVLPGSTNSGSTNSGSTNSGATNPRFERPFVPASSATESSANGAAVRRQDVNLDAKMAQRGTIILRDAHLGEWLFAIQQEWKINIVFSNELQSEIVNGAFEDLSLRDVLDAILLPHGYGYQRIGNSLMIVNEDKMGQMKPQFKDAIIPMQYLTPQDVEPTVRILLSPGGLVQTIPTSKSLYIVDLPERIEKVQAHLAKLEDQARVRFERDEERRRAEEPLRVPQQSGSDFGPLSDPLLVIEEEKIEVFQMRFVDADAVAEAMQSVIGSDGRVTVLDEENKVVVIAPVSAIRAAADLLAQIDVARPQVRITALLYDVRVEDMERLGFNWSNRGTGRGGRSTIDLTGTNFATGVSVTEATGDAADAIGETVGVVSNPIGGLLTLHHLSNNFQLDTIISAFSEVEGARLLARPNVIAYDGIPAEFKAVSEIPVQQLTQTTNGGNIGTTQFREAGITLAVTPRIANDGSLRLEIAPEFSVLSGFQAGQPIIDRRSAQTTVHMHDGQTVVIGGLLRRSELETQRGIPGLKNLKHLGPLFRDHETTISDSELLVFVRAEIIRHHQMEPRQEIAQSVLDEGVEQIAVATPHPVLPPCGDPYCPYHNPTRMWIESPMHYEHHVDDPKHFEHTDFAPLPDTTTHARPEYGIPDDATPNYGTPDYGTPDYGTPDYGSPANAGPRGSAQDPTRLPLTESSPQRSQPPQTTPTTTGPAFEVPHAENRFPAVVPPIEGQLPEFEVGPPPVIIDEAARIRASAPASKFVIRRLPHISNETSERALAPVSTFGSDADTTRRQWNPLPRVNEADDGSTSIEPTSGGTRDLLRAGGSPKRTLTPRGLATRTATTRTADGNEPAARSVRSARSAAPQTTAKPTADSNWFQRLIR